MKIVTHSTVLATLKRYRFFWLLLAVVFCVITTPLAHWDETTFFTATTLYAIIILTAVNAASDSRTHLVVAITLAVLWLFGNWLGFLLGNLFDLVAADLIFICLLTFAMYLILRPMLQAKETDFDMLSGATAVYLLVAIAWAVSYGMIEQVHPGTFDDGTDGGMGWSSSLYFSLTTLTTLGYGDVTPTNPLAGTWATLEAVVGQLYVAVLIARIVGLIRA